MRDASGRSSGSAATELNSRADISGSDCLLPIRDVVFAPRHNAIASVLIDRLSAGFMRDVRSLPPRERLARYEAFLFAFWPTLGERIAHFALSNGFGAIVERDNKRDAFLPVEFGAYGRIETLSLEDKKTLIDRSQVEAKLWNSIRQDQTLGLLRALGSLTPSKSCHPPPDGLPRWHRLDSLELTA